MHKSLLTLCSHGPIAVTIRVLGNIVRSPQRHPRLRGMGIWRKEGGESGAAALLF